MHANARFHLCSLTGTQIQGKCAINVIKSSLTHSPTCRLGNNPKTTLPPLQQHHTVLIWGGETKIAGSTLTGQ
jgi:hypothetical protein